MDIFFNVLQSFWNLYEPDMKMYNFNSKGILSSYFWNKNYDSKTDYELGIVVLAEEKE